MSGLSVSGGTRLYRLCWERCEQVGVAAAAEIQYLVANGYADGGLRCTLEYAKRAGSGYKMGHRDDWSGLRGALPPATTCSIHGCIIGAGLPVKCFLSACHTWK